MPASYPNLIVDDSSTMGFVDTLTTERASNGTLRGRSFSAGATRTFNAVHPQVDAAQLSSLLAFYEANKTQPVLFLWPHDGVTYTVQFTGVPKPKKLHAAGCLDVAVDLAEV